LVSKKDDVVKKVVEGKIGLHQVDAEAGPDDAVEIRRRAVEKLSGTSLANIGSARMDYSMVKGRNAENVIGMTSIPVGVVGPLKVNGLLAAGEFYVPMATTEGALIASIARGIKAINMSGGATVRIIKDGMTRGPAFSFDSVEAVGRFIEWLPNNFERIRKAAQQTLKHGRLDGITPYVLGNNVFLRFRYDTGDAMGMNMVTIATEAACSAIEEGFEGARLVAVSGNMCSDKKQSLVNSLDGRGKTVVAEVLVKDAMLRDVLHTSAGKANEVNLTKNWAGSARAGSATQFNAHFANSIAAIFAATGQDLAQVVESSSGYTWTEIRGRDLYIAITLTSLEIGTVGGGTGLPTQKEALSMMKVAGSGNPVGSNSRKLAEIIAAAVLAGELNLLCALAARDLGKAHQKLGRGKAWESAGKA
jgi:hydroxymethylglutaryl-CoA reductase (NADPH)